MVTVDGNWRMEGLDRSDPKRVKTAGELSKVIEDIGFLPLFKNSVPGFSVEEMTASDSWWSGRDDEDPWQWREVIAEEGRIAYGKLFCNRAGFVSRDWYPCLASYRRDGYDFDSRYEDGLASYRSKKIMDLLEIREAMLSNEIKSAAGFIKGGEKGFESTISLLQMQTYITVRAFRQRRNKRNEGYGWPVAVYCLSERLFGEEHVRSMYHLSAPEAKESVVSHLAKKFPQASVSDINKAV